MSCSQELISISCEISQTEHVQQVQSLKGHALDPTELRLELWARYCLFARCNIGSGFTPCPRAKLLTAAIIEFCGPAVGMTGDSLSGYKGAIVFQKMRDAGRLE
jgi:hypothetical protein